MMNEQDSPKILIVEDEPKLAAVLADYLHASGYRTHCIERGDEVLPWVQENDHNLILLDLMLPGKDGMDLCREIRAFSQIPIIIMTARTEEIDRLLGFGLGADDYVCKPYSPREIVARVQVILRRVQSLASSESPEVYRGLTLDESAFSCEFEGQKVDLTPVEFRMLAALAKNPGHVLRREQLCSHAYEDHRVVSVQTINTHIKNLRRKLNEVSTEGDLIHSVYGVGYKLE